MKDHEARKEIVELKVRLETLVTALDKVDVDNYDFTDYKRQFHEVVKELGFSFDELGSLDREANVNSSLGRLQAQISALVEVLGFTETYDKGTLRYEKVR
jgi:hypothetical protein